MIDLAHDYDVRATAREVAAELSRQSGKCDGLIIHQVWIQGADKLPMEYVRRQALWRAAFPEATFKLWDHASACAAWSDYKALSDRCATHATRADLILARALRDIGGLATGTDTQPLWPGVNSLRSWLQANDSLVLSNPNRDEASNGLAFFKTAGHPFITAVCAEQIARPERLALANVPEATGPQCWFRVLRKRSWDLCLVSDAHAYCQLWHDATHNNPRAWVNPGYAASWKAGAVQVG